MACCRAKFVYNLTLSECQVSWQRSDETLMLNLLVKFYECVAFDQRVVILIYSAT